MGKLSELFGRAIENFYKSAEEVRAHTEDVQNPHRVTKAQVGLGNVSNITAAPLADFNSHKAAGVLAHPDKSVTADKLADGAVTTAKIAEGAVTSGKVCGGAITPEKLSGVVPVQKGGTGGSTPSAARKALGAMGAGEGQNILNNASLIANGEGGFAAGEESRAASGGAVGKNAVAGDGFAGGSGAETVAGGKVIDAIQLGQGTNTEAKSLQVYDRLLLDAGGNIPYERTENSAKVRKYGVRFEGASNTAGVTRLFNADGLTSVPGTTLEQGYSDFDSLYPWSGRRRLCGYFDSDGNMVINAYEGEPGYDAYGSNGEVWVETPLFYYRHTYGEDGSEEICISNHKLEGFLPSPAHVNSDGRVREVAYTAAYPMGMKEGKPVSRSKTAPLPVSADTAMTAAKSLGSGYRVTTAAEHYTRCLLMWVEFATRDLQSVMSGCAALAFDDSIKVIRGLTNSNMAVVSTQNGRKFVIGQRIGIGAFAGDDSIASAREVVDACPYDSDSYCVMFDGTPVTTSVGDVIFSMPWAAGCCDGVKGSSGSVIENAGGIFPCVYRGEENPYGNGYEVISDLLIKREGSGTSASPYTYVVYYLPDTAKYTGSLTGSYIRLFSCAAVTGAVRRLGYDSRYPFVRVPSDAGVGTNEYYADNYQKPEHSLTAAAVGGCFAEGAYAGPACWSLAWAPSERNVFTYARLSFNQEGR